MPEHNPGQLGGTMRLGKRTTVFKSEENTICKYDLHWNILFAVTTSSAFQSDLI
jgi:hypothetical protein